MGHKNSKTEFSKWDLDRFSNVTGVPRATVEKLYKEFDIASGKDNKLDKKEFRRLYKEMMASGQGGTIATSGGVSGTTAVGTTPSTLVISDHDADKIADRVLKAFDTDNSGKLTFEEFVNAYVMLNERATPSQRVGYVVDQSNPTPGYVSKEYGQHVYDQMNRYYQTADTTKSTTVASSGSAPQTTTWEQHWSKMDNGTGNVPVEKYVEYVTTNSDLAPFLSSSSTTAVHH